jgi:hypothetical protein
MERSLLVIVLNLLVDKRSERLPNIQNRKQPPLVPKPL